MDSQKENLGRSGRRLWSHVLTGGLEIVGPVAPHCINKLGNTCTHRRNSDARGPGRVAVVTQIRVGDIFIKITIPGLQLVKLAMISFSYVADYKFQPLFSSTRFLTHFPWNIFIRS